jgi:hypothetical protein
MNKAGILKAHHTGSLKFKQSSCGLTLNPRMVVKEDQLKGKMTQEYFSD